MWPYMIWRPGKFHVVKKLILTILTRGVSKHLVIYDTHGLSYLVSDRSGDTSDLTLIVVCLLTISVQCYTDNHNINKMIIFPLQTQRFNEWKGAIEIIDCWPSSPSYFRAINCLFTQINVESLNLMRLLCVLNVIHNRSCLVSIVEIRTHSLCPVFLTINSSYLFGFHWE